MTTTEKTNKYIAQSYKRTGLELQKGSAAFVTDENGKEFIDFGSGIGTNSLGYADSEWADAVCGQLKTLQHTSNYYANKISADFAEKLCGITGYGRLFFGNSGAEANECVIKTARKYSFDKYGKGRHTIITLNNSFHGRTMATLSATGQDVFHNYFFPFLEGFKFAEPDNTADLKEKLDDTVCAVMFEYVQGEGGVIPLEQGYIDEIFELCAGRDILTIADEVQTGAGRTGKFLAGEHYGKKADITTLAKGIGGGLPIGICLFGEKTQDVLTSGTHGSTFGGNPAVCAGGLKVLEKAGNPEFLSEVTKKGELIRNTLLKIPEVVTVTGRGLMIGIELKTKKAGDVMDACAQKGLLTLTAKEKLRLLPPLTVDYDSIDKGLEILSAVLK